MSEAKPIKSHHYDYIIKCKLNKDDTSTYAKVDKEESMRSQPFTENYRQLSEGWRTPTVSQCQMINPENIHLRNFIWTEHVIFRNAYVFIYVTYV